MLATFEDKVIMLDELHSHVPVYLVCMKNIGRLSKIIQQGLYKLEFTLRKKEKQVMDCESDTRQG